MEEDAEMLMDGSIVGSTELPIAQQTVDPVDVYAGALTDLSLVPEDRFSEEDESDSDDSVDSTQSPTYQTYVQVENFPPARSKQLPYSSKRSGLCYDVRMRFHSEYPEAQARAGNDIEAHPEEPRRIFAIFEALKKAGLVEDEGNPDVDPNFTLFRISARHAHSSEICLVHERQHYDMIKALRRMSEDQLVELGASMGSQSVYFHKLTFECARLAAGGAIETCRAVVAGHIKNAIAVIRPPGHHAERDGPSGFCMFDNVAVATKVCQRDFPKECRKVLILDWDVHHGNGVQQAFENDPNVLYISLHVYRNGSFYPNTEYGDHLHCGEGVGKGFNVNIPWADVGMGDGDYIYAFQEIVMPIAMEFNPDLVIISAGFDAAEGDPLGQCHVSPPGYAHMTHSLMSLAGGKLAVVLEGGYNLGAISKSALAVTRTLMGEPPDRFIPDATPVPSALGVSTVNVVKKTQAAYWKCMYPKPVKVPKQAEFGRATGRLHDIIREWQSDVLWKEFAMSALMINRTNLSKSFDNQVMATPNHFEDRPLLVIFHDPPEVQMIRDMQANKLDLHNTWLTDVTKTYIDWAIKHDFAVIDINIPKHITEIEDSTEHREADAKEKRLASLREAATYMWENYIEVNDNTQVILMGIGDGYSSILELIASQENCEERIDKIISFVCDTSLVSIKRPTDDSIAGWYHKHSMVFVSGDHPAWDPDRKIKLRKKFGNLIRSTSTTTTEMLVEHKDQITSELESLTDGWREEQRSKGLLASQTKPSPGTRAAENLNAVSQALKGFNKEDEGEDSLNGTITPLKGIGSPLNPALKSPTKLPPMGFFTNNTSPKRRDVRDREGCGASR